MSIIVSSDFYPSSWVSDGVTPLTNHLEVSTIETTLSQLLVERKQAVRSVVLRNLNKIAFCLLK